MDEKDDGERGIVESKVKVCQSDQHGGLGSGTYEIGERRTRERSRNDQWKYKWSEGKHRGQGMKKIVCTCQSV